MSDEKPNPVADVIKGLGLLFRAAKTTVERLPTKNLEEAVVTSAREVGRAIENVATTVEREVFGRREAPPATRPPEPRERASKPDEPSDPKPPDAA